MSADGAIAQHHEEDHHHPHSSQEDPSSQSKRSHPLTGSHEPMVPRACLSARGYPHAGSGRPGRTPVPSVEPGCIDLWTVESGIVASMTLGTRGHWRPHRTGRRPRDARASPRYTGSSRSRLSNQDPSFHDNAPWSVRPPGGPRLVGTRLGVRQATGSAREVVPVDARSESAREPLVYARQASSQAGSPLSGYRGPEEPDRYLRGPKRAPTTPSGRPSRWLEWPLEWPSRGSSCSDRHRRNRVRKAA